MNLNEFDTLKHRDFDSGAVIRELREVVKSHDTLVSENEKIRTELGNTTVELAAAFLKNERLKEALKMARQKILDLTNDFPDKTVSLIDAALEDKES